MDFWTIEHPVDSRVWDGVIISGSVSLPGVMCPRCGSTWSGDEILPFPVNNKALKLIERYPRCILHEEFIALKTELASILGLDSETEKQLTPGALSPPITVCARHSLPVWYAGEFNVVREDFLSLLSASELGELSIIATLGGNKRFGGGYIVKPKLVSDLPIGLNHMGTCPTCGRASYEKTCGAVQYTRKCHSRLLAENKKLSFFQSPPLTVF